MPKAKSAGKPKAELERHYSGSLSEQFWDRVNALPDREQRLAYSLGCALQDLEHRVLAYILEAEESARKPKAAR